MADPLPIRCWARTSWIRRDYDARRATTQVRYGKLHALQDSAPDHNSRFGILSTIALCGRWYDFTWFHNDPDPPPNSLTRDFCNRCLERSAEVDR